MKCRFCSAENEDFRTQCRVCGTVLVYPLGERPSGEISSGANIEVGDGELNGLPINDPPEALGEVPEATFAEAGDSPVATLEEDDDPSDATPDATPEATFAEAGDPSEAPPEEAQGPLLSPLAQRRGGGGGQLRGEEGLREHAAFYEEFQDEGPMISQGKRASSFSSKFIKIALVVVFVLLLRLILQ
ncbi:MAG: hypothetical protein Q4E76_02655 [Tissierellia bacterium]|nr:hypothetical protein [Tissierellia bacterium]